MSKTDFKKLYNFLNLKWNFFVNGLVGSRLHIMLEKFFTVVIKASHKHCWCKCFNFVEHLFVVFLVLTKALKKHMKNLFLLFFYNKNVSTNILCFKYHVSNYFKMLSKLISSGKSKLNPNIFQNVNQLFILRIWSKEFYS